MTGVKGWIVKPFNGAAVIGSFKKLAGVQDFPGHLALLFTDKRAASAHAHR